MTTPPTPQVRQQQGQTARGTCAPAARPWLPLPPHGRPLPPAAAAGWQGRRPSRPLPAAQRCAGGPATPRQSHEVSHAPAAPRPGPGRRRGDNTRTEAADDCPERAATRTTIGWRGGGRCRGRHGADAPCSARALARQARAERPPSACVARGATHRIPGRRSRAAAALHGAAGKTPVRTAHYLRHGVEDVPNAEPLNSGDAAELPRGVPPRCGKSVLCRPSRPCCVSAVTYVYIHA